MLFALFASTRIITYKIKKVNKKKIMTMTKQSTSFSYVEFTTVKKGSLRDFKSTGKYAMVRDICFSIYGKKFAF